MSDRASVDTDTDLATQVKSSDFLQAINPRVGGGVFCHFDPLIPVSFFALFVFFLRVCRPLSLPLSVVVDTLRARNLFSIQARS